MKKLIIFCIILCLLLPIVYGSRSADIYFGNVVCEDDGTLRIDIRKVEGTIKTKDIKIIAKEKQKIIRYGAESYELTGKDINITGNFWSTEPYNEKRLTRTLFEKNVSDSWRPDFYFTSDLLFNKTYPVIYDISFFYSYEEEEEEKEENETVIFSDIECPAFLFSCDLVSFDVIGCKQEGDNVYVSFITEGFDQPKKINLLSFDFCVIKGTKSMLDSLPGDAELIKEGPVSEIKFTFEDEIETIKIKPKIPCTGFSEKNIYKCEQLVPIEKEETIPTNITVSAKQIENKTSESNAITIVKDEGREDIKPDEDVIEQAEDAAIKEVSFFGRVINWLKNLFGK